MKSWRSFFFGLCIGLLSAALILIGNGRLEGKPILLSPPLDPPGVRVSVRGAVTAPGIYPLAAGSIVQDALDAAGGILAEADTSRLNLAAVLESLPGIGPVLAQRIIDYREVHGPFQTLEDLLGVDGVGPSLLNKIRDLVEV
jgi:competence protein ComEA